RPRRRRFRDRRFAGHGDRQDEGHDLVAPARPRVLPDAQRQPARLEDALLDEAVRRAGDAEAAQHVARPRRRRPLVDQAAAEPGRGRRDGGGRAARRAGADRGPLVSAATSSPPAPPAAPLPAPVPGPPTATLDSSSTASLSSIVVTTRRGIETTVLVGG